MTIRDMEREREESVRALRGVAFGVLFSIPVWGSVLMASAIFGAR